MKINRIASTIATSPENKKYCSVLITAYNLTICAFSPCAIAFVKNHSDIICERNASGDSFVVVDNPIGEIQSSPSVTSKKLSTNHNGLIKPSVPKGMTMTRDYVSLLLARNPLVIETFGFRIHIVHLRR